MNFFKKKKRSNVRFVLNDKSFDVGGYVKLSDCEEVKRCVNIIADFVSNMTIMLLSNGDVGDERIKNDLSRTVDINPNPYMTRKNLIKRIVKDVYLTGNAVCIPVFNKGKLESIMPLVAKRCQFLEDGNTYKVSYQNKEFNQNEILHFLIDPSEAYPWKGLDCLSNLKNTVLNIAQANATKKGFLKSEWKPSLIISVNSDAAELMDADLRENIVSSYIKTNKVGEPWIIPADEIEVKEVKPLTLQDLAIQEGLQLDIGSVAAALGVPKFYVGIGEYDKEAHNNFVETTVMFVATQIQQELTKKLIPKEQLHFKFNGKSLLQYSQKDKAEFAKTMVSLGMINRNEGRSEFDYAPVDLQEMNEYQVLENYIPIDRLGDQKKLEEKED